MYYVPAQQLNLQQIKNGQQEYGIQNTEVPKMKTMPWPMSKPKSHQKQIHVSLNRDYGNIAQQSLSPQATLSEYQYQQRSPLVDVSQLHMTNVPHHPIIQQSEDILYSCTFIAQLQGSYEMETSTGTVQVSVILPKVYELAEQYAKVKLVSNDGSALGEKFIYNELSCFQLCSANRKVEGVLMKGSNMKHSVEWWNAEDQSWSIWRRNRNVSFNLVQVDPNSRRNSLSSVCTVSTCPIVPYAIDTSAIGIDENPMRIRTELLQPKRPVFLNRSSTGPYSQTVSLQSNSNKFVLDGQSEQDPEKMFKHIKAQCEKNAILFKKVVDWGIANNPARRISRDERKYLSEGRFWITAHTEDVDEGEVPIDSLDDIKGAYQETSAGIYMQPDPKECGSLFQHRLLKDQHRCWLLERQDLGSERWQIRARQQEDGRWIDFKHKRMVIRVHIVPLSSILEKFDEEHLTSKNEIKKSLDFLFTSCNQEKLTRLKGRNLKHHIANLKVKLEKRYALSFGVRVANIAETIVVE